jgi:hypothetical protein
LLRYGRRVAYYEGQVRSAGGEAGVNGAVGQVTPEQWRGGRAEQRARQEEQLKQYRFRHKRGDVSAVVGGALGRGYLLNAPIALTVFLIQLSWVVSLPISA